MAEPMQQVDLGERVPVGSFKEPASCAACILEHALDADFNSLHNERSSVAPATYRAIDRAGSAVWWATKEGAPNAEY